MREDILHLEYKRNIKEIWREAPPSNSLRRMHYASNIQKNSSTEYIFGSFEIKNDYSQNIQLNKHKCIRKSVKGFWLQELFPLSVGLYHSNTVQYSTFSKAFNSCFLNAGLVIHNDYRSRDVFICTFSGTAFKHEIRTPYQNKKSIKFIK